LFCNAKKFAPRIPRRSFEVPLFRRLLQTSNQSMYGKGHEAFIKCSHDAESIDGSLAAKYGVNR
jgi:hypothetical protein